MKDEWKEADTTAYDTPEYDEINRQNWNEIGTTVHGKVADIFEAEYGHGYVIEIAEDEAVIVYDGPKALENGLEEVSEGNEVKITYEGDVELDEDKTTKEFEVLYR